MRSWRQANDRIAELRGPPNPRLDRTRSLLKGYGLSIGVSLGLVVVSLVKSHPPQQRRNDGKDGQPG